MARIARNPENEKRRESAWEGERERRRKERGRVRE